MAKADINWQTSEALKALKARYFFYLDSKDWDGWRSLFADDAILDVSAQFPDAPDPSVHVLHGADRIVAAVSRNIARTITVHHGHNPLFTLESETEATGIWALEDQLFMPGGKRMTGYGHYHERYRRIGDAWRFAHIRLSRIHMIYW